VYESLKILCTLSSAHNNIIFFSSSAVLWASDNRIRLTFLLNNPDLLLYPFRLRFTLLRFLVAFLLGGKIDVTAGRTCTVEAVRGLGKKRGT
jgi:hypothetical protein